jgi:NTP pyrophosphatase (non-canonical NTP hydrolase)
MVEITIMINITNAEINSLKNNIEKMARRLGGYWPPLSATARVLEELGEVGEYILNKDFHEEFASELSDVLIITTCIANQYCAKFTISKTHFEKDFSQWSIEEIYIKLVGDCGELARIINSYEGSKKLKETEHPTTVEKQTSLILFDLLIISHKAKCNLLQQTENTVKKVLKRDKNRFENVYDPVSSYNHDTYLKLSQKKRKFGA